MVGTLLMFSQPAYVQFDFGSTHSFVSPLFVKYFVEKPVPLNFLLLVATPSGKTILVRVDYRSCRITVGKKDTVADLMLLEVMDFDLIFGMD